MAEITIDVSDLILPELKEAFAWDDDYDRNKRGSETKGQFAKRILAQFSKSKLHKYKKFLADEISNRTLNDEMEDIDIS